MGEKVTMRPAECPECGEMIEATDLRCNNCDLGWVEWPDGWIALLEIDGNQKVYYSEGHKQEWKIQRGTDSPESSPLSSP